MRKDAKRRLKDSNESSFREFLLYLTFHNAGIPMIEKNNPPPPWRLCRKSVHGSTGSPRTDHGTLEINYLAVRPEHVEGRAADCDTVSWRGRERSPTRHSHLRPARRDFVQAGRSGDGAVGVNRFSSPSPSSPEAVKKLGEPVGQGYLQSFTNAVH